ncbi:8-amino-7-oxononanoate synthase [Methylotuvimicrobium alcaliphilum]|uniref:8-amino-7-oxononanoate synthase n=1 Tax=Methylotuvimicrobium alcaliphilum (strain DSM 19304 / NCIMB 14124 / VKM B-2133 / 20Z) TaxID=1091494 RepID=G4SUU2_META2|nr:8-amino-7-oxononanoate synthase [Methylotuvimicrobium alcaliphilum]CCE24001.1 8-amino-7-oxononanoate synthase [Methylotuvimicrobium alcaliphilum 20Z]
MIGIESGLDAELERLAREDLYRTRRVVESAQGVELQCGGRKLINFCGNDYLGLANHPAVVKAFQDGAARYGVGSGSAHLICGHGSAHHALEEELAEFTGRDRALLFSTGYMANIGVISALTGKGDTVFEDRLNHASLLDGGLLSGARFKRYRHADADGLLDSLNRTEGRSMIVTDGVFSMDGDLAPLDVLSQIAKDQDTCLMVDDAHGLGVIGDKGRGIVEHFGLTQQQVPILVGTLGKAFGTFGAFVAGSETLIETLIQKARTYIYTTALPPAVAEATRAALNILIEDQWRRENLNDLVRRFRRGAEQLGFPLMPSNSAIQPILIGDSRRAVEIGKRLLDDGFWVGAIRPPTVPQGSARLRVTFSALHDEQQVDRLLESLAKSISQ